MLHMFIFALDASMAQVRDKVIGGFQAACDRINANPDLQIRLPLDPSMHDKVIAASAT